MNLGEWIRCHAYTHGFTCDACRGELFDYYPRRLCDSCLQKLHTNDSRTCPKCGRHTVALGVCLACKNRMPKYTKGFSPFVYRGETARLINSMKNGARRLTFFFGERMGECVLQALDRWNGADRVAINEDSALIVYVPISKKRRRERGYNQAEELAVSFHQTLAKAGLTVSICKDAITLNRDMQSQKELQKGDRAKNVKGAYHIKHRAACKNKMVFLIDDIMTTGATGSECADALVRAGAKAVFFITAASLEEEVEENS